MALVRIDSPMKTCQDRNCNGLGFTTPPAPAAALPDWLQWALIALAVLIAARLIFGATPAGRRRAQARATERARARYRREVADIRARYA